MFRSSLFTIIAIVLFTTTAAAQDATLETLLTLGNDSHKNGDYVQSEDYFRRAIERAATAEASDKQKAHAYAGLGAVLLIRQRLEESETALDLAGALLERSRAPDLLSLSVVLGNLAALYQKMGQYERAQSTFERAITLKKKYFGRENVDVADSRAGLAALYLKMGKTNKAESTLKDVLAFEEQQLGGAHPHLAPILTNLASVYLVQNKWPLAEALLLRALQNMEPASAEHPDICLTLDTLGILYSKQGNLHQAETVFRRALELRRKSFGPEHPYTVMTAVNLASVRGRQGDFEEASNLFAESLQIQEKILGPRHAEVAGTLERYADLLRQSNLVEQAKDMDDRAQIIRSELRHTISIKTLTPRQLRR